MPDWKKINQTNEEFSGYAIYNEITKENINDFDIFGDTGNDHLVLMYLHQDDMGNVADNPNIFYYGGTGVDTLEFGGSDLKRVIMNVDDEYDFHIEGGFGKHVSGDHKLDSLDVKTRDVESFILTDENDEVYGNGARFGITVDAGKGADSLFGTDYDDTFIGGNGDDYIKGQVGNDLLYGDSGQDTLAGGDGDDTMYGGSDNDTMTGGADNDVMDGGEGQDTLNAGDGNDSLVGGADSDTLYGAGGNDTIVAGDVGEDVAEIVHGGSGSDVIIANVDIAQTSNIQVWGDGSNSSNGNAAGSYNEADTFIIGATSRSTSVTYVDLPETQTPDTSYDDMAELVTSVASSLAKKAPGGVLASAAVEIGFTFGSAALKDLIVDGMDANVGLAIEQMVTSPSQVFINDLDLWGDTVVLAQDSSGADITGEASFSLLSGATTSFSTEDYKYLTMSLDFLTTSVLEGETGFDASIFYDATIKQELLDNLLANSLYVKSVDKGSGFFTTTATTLSGIDLVLDDPDSGDTTQQDALDTMLSTSGADGVWIMGDYGASILFGNDKALAGTNSDNVMYSSSYDSQTYGNWFDTAAGVEMFGGAGDDVLFGNDQGGNKLYGGSGDDVLHAVGHSGTNPDDLYGGTGTDIASFESIYSIDSNGFANMVAGFGSQVNNNYSGGIYANLGDAAITAWVLEASDWSLWNAEYATSGTFLTPNSDEHNPDANAGTRVANLHGMEGLKGTDNNDVLGGDSGDNILVGHGGDDILVGADGNDVLVGSEGNDILTGGAGADTFMMDGVFGNDTITDFEIADTLIFKNVVDPSAFTTGVSGNDATLTLGSAGTVALSGFADRSLTQTSVANSDNTYDVTFGFLSAAASRVYDPTPLSDLEALQYLASYDDLIDAFGYDLDAAKAHYEVNGRAEQRQITFDAEQYLENYTDLAAAFGANTTIATDHYVSTGYYEGRSYAANLTDTLPGVTAVASSTADSSSAADKILDNDIDTFNHTALSDSASWLSVDLGGEALIEAVTIWNRNDGDTAHQAIVNGRLDGATVELYNDGTWVAEHTLTSAVNQSFDFGAVFADELRIYSNDGDHLHVAEVDIFGHENLTDRLDQMQAVSMSSLYGNYGAHLVLDGDVTTFNHTQRSDSEWLSIDLGADALIETIMLENRQDNWTSRRLEGANVEILDDDVVVWSSADLTQDHSQQIHVGGIIGDQMRVSLENEILHIAEVDIYGGFL
ncbi:discoidin domain-containing protein [Leisingera sp. MMG026]|uniref:discoidin domain-containing protein n=1 Tax=Leisingera sp. MMG026 TaxID=2909982 RepID=UPI001F217FBD|nr:discoidin domain-containing protein [Leisingera sp. MMG026]MCF6433515.1 discoidin domain-containing protein [Leisingera sp. MMG026]